MSKTNMFRISMLVGCVYFIFAMAWSIIDKFEWYDIIILPAITTIEMFIFEAIVNKKYRKEQEKEQERVPEELPDIEEIKNSIEKGEL